MKRVILAAFVALGALGTLQISAPAANAIDRCATVRCMACPEGYVFSPTGNNCCRCVPAN